MPRYIDADALKDELELADFETDSRMFGGQTVLFKDSVFKIVDSAPTISPDEVRGVGEWICDPISAVSPVEEWYCNICKQPAPMGYGKAYVRTNYCPNCGATMEVNDGKTA